MHLFTLTVWINLAIFYYVIGCADANLVERISHLKETRNDDGFEDAFNVQSEFTSNKASSERNPTNFEQAPQIPKRVKMKRRKMHNKMEESISFLPHHAHRYRTMKSDKTHNLTIDDGAFDKSGFIATTNENHSQNQNNINGKHIPSKKKLTNLISIQTKRQRKFKEGKAAGKKSDTLKRKRKHRKKQTSSLPSYNDAQRWLDSASIVNGTSIHKIPLITSTDDANQKSIMGLVDNATDNIRSDVTEFMLMGDLSCLDNGFIPAPDVEHADIKYFRNDTPDNKNALIEAQYICHRGYNIDFNQIQTKSNIFCQNGEWIGKLPKCVRSHADMVRNCQQPEICEHICHVDNAGLEYCTCYKGFRMKNDRCVDINECEEYEDICDLDCVNTLGSYRCKCPKGFRIGDMGTCLDVNECRLQRNGHGPCQDTCINFWGGYNCTCNGLAGTKLAENGHDCEDLDECLLNNGGCSHTCLNTYAPVIDGRSFCLCPPGWILDDSWKTCIDIDECTDHEVMEKLNIECQYGCENTPGSYKCLENVQLNVRLFAANDEQDENDTDVVQHLLCPDGFKYNTTSRSCADVDECAGKVNSGCYDQCINTMGSYYCSCKVGSILSEDKYTCIALNITSDVMTCPPLFPPHHGYLECTQPTSYTSGKNQITNSPGSQCILICPNGYRMSGSFAKTCGMNGKWIGTDNGECIRYPTPRLICPSDVIYETIPNKSFAVIKVLKPKTDVNWDHDVMTNPIWVKNGPFELGVGMLHINYTATHPISHISVSCDFTVTVLVGEAPISRLCPPTQSIVLSNHEDRVKVNWEEPEFKDNVNVTKITHSNVPGSYFGVGSHQILYTAYDFAGYKTKCIFMVSINVPTLQHHHTDSHQNSTKRRFLPIYDFF